jgi:bifunctional UDP-N-acetylglucosamine pyrophosphorylase/glucosamine-1-phosphate N-acetyltransferase
MSRTQRVIIPAAGRSSRSGLNYPKSLYRIKDIPILVRLCQKLKEYDDSPLIIINQQHELLFQNTLEEFGITATFVYQNEPAGMGHALLQAEEHIEENEDVLLVWSDIPMLDALTIRHMVDCHIVSQNDFSFVTAICDSCYTIVSREKGLVRSVIETRAAGMLPGKGGERDIGLFIFKKQPLFSLLKEEGGIAEVNGRKEFGCKVEGYPLAKEEDLLSFNTPEDLRQIETAFTGLSHNKPG